MINLDASGHVDLRSAYVESRLKASSTAKYTTASCPAGVCRYCGRSWRYTSSRNDGHATCLVGPEFRALVCATWWNTPRLSRDDISTQLGVTYSTVAAWTNDRQVKMARVA